MMRRTKQHLTVLLVAGLLLLLIFGSAALAQSRPITCFPRDHVVTVLEDQYGEAMVDRQVAANGSHVVELWANDSTGTWTIIVRLPDGLSCPVREGTGEPPILGVAT